MNSSQSGSFLVGALIALAVAAVIGGGGYAVYEYIIKPPSPPPSPPSAIDAEQIAYATTNMFHLFRDAQYDYIHRHGGTMAKSVTELGDGFSIGSFGSLIHEEIWLARLDRPEGECVPQSQQSQLERNILARPFRYAVLPVANCFGDALDARTTCILAVPVAPDAEPMLVMLAGPIRSDPRDFYQSYPIHEVSDASSRKAFREAAKNGTPVDKAFFDQNLPEWKTASASMQTTISTGEN